MAANDLAQRRRERIQRPIRLLQRFIHLESASGILLFGAAVVALVWANSPWASGYVSLWKTELSLELGGAGLSKPLLKWINDGLMALFFFLVGLEIKRELLVGSLASFRRAMLPMVVAIGGMVVPALVYVAFTGGTDAVQGWGIPMATDIAFALGVLALLGRRVPVGLKALLLAVAIVDDIGAVLVIALFYSEGIAWSVLGYAGLVMVALILASRLGARHPLVYAGLGVLLWLFVLQSGLHATIAGVLVAMTVPARRRIDATEFLRQGREALDHFERKINEEERGMVSSSQQAAVESLSDAQTAVATPLQRMEHALHPWVAFGIMPLFALANAGVTITGEMLAGGLHPVIPGVALGLVVGKPLGVAAFAWLAVRSRVADLPVGVGWAQIVGIGLLAGIGFTMSLFITGLAFEGTPFADLAKVGILAGSLAAGLLGWALLRASSPAVSSAEDAEVADGDA